ncbi:hypothetical protein FQA39_LY06937 [Lamprigera yunnana]|nr:hypothetical protein FQA39_LY06937 [Lamprigera yunnana]
MKIFIFHESMNSINVVYRSSLSSKRKASSESKSFDNEHDNKKWSEEDLSGSNLTENFHDLSETDSSSTSVTSQTGPSNVPCDRSKGYKASTLKVDDFVVINFEEKLFTGRMTEVKPEGYIVSTMDRFKMYCKWPTRKFAILYSKEEVLYIIEPPRPVGNLENANFLPTHSSDREKVSTRKSFLITLWYLSNQKTYRQVSDPFDDTESAAWKIIRRVIDYLVSISATVIKWPSDKGPDEIPTELL